MKWLSFTRLIDECNGQGALMQIPVALIEESIDFGILQAFGRMEVYTSFEFVAVALLCKVAWDAICLHDLDPYQ